MDSLLDEELHQIDQSMSPGDQQDANEKVFRTWTEGQENEERGSVDDAMYQYAGYLLVFLASPKICLEVEIPEQM